MSTSRQYAIGKRIVDIINDLRLDGIRDGDVRLEQYPNNEKPEYGIIVAFSEETEQAGLNNQDDVVYSFKIIRVYHTIPDELEMKADWRDAIRERFNHRRIGVNDDEACELVTRVRFGDIEIKPEWDRRNLDNNILVIAVAMRIRRT